MKNSKLKSQISGIFGAFWKATDLNAPSMRFRLYAFLYSTVVLLVLVVLLILFLAGRFPAGTSDAERFTSREFNRLYASMTEQCGELTVQLVSLSQSLSRSIEFYLSEKQISVSDLQSHTEVLEELLGNELSRLQFALEKTDNSGVFVILDATINPELDGAEHSRAGMYIRISEPRVPGAADATWNYFRGFPRIAYQNGMNIMVRWDMEFDVSGIDFYHLPIEQSRATSLPLSRLYYWSMEGVIPGLDDAVLLCSIPLIDSYGNTFGVCGFELSEWNFSRLCTPDDSEYRSITSIFGMMDGDMLNIDGAMISGSPAATGGLRGKGRFPLPADDGFSVISLENDSSFYGLFDEIRLYPFDSPFAKQQFSFALLIPTDEVDTIILHANLQTILICLVILVLGVIASYFAANRYLSPITSALDSIRSGNLDGVKTHIAEIDQLIDQIQNQSTNDRPFPDDLFSDIIKRSETLSPTEKKILRSHVDAMADKEIMSTLFITKHALNKHSERIYEKLGVSGKQSLMLYIELIKMSRQSDWIR